MSTEATIQTTVLRYYTEKGQAKVEAVVWRWVPGDPNESDVAKGSPVDPGLAARARALPAEYDPGMVPNRWVWIGANDVAAKLPRPGETIRGEISTPDGETREKVDHQHGEGSTYWDFYRLPLRAGVELIDQDAWLALRAEAERAEVVRKADQKALIEAQQAEREVHRASARDKLSKLGLTEDEIQAIVRG